MAELITFIAPSSASEARYSATLSYVESLIRRTIGAEVFCHGSFALKTYLPDADLDVSAFFSRSNDDSWIQRLVAVLCQEAAGGGAGGAALLGAAGQQGGKDRDRDKSRDRDRERERERADSARMQQQAADAASASPLSSSSKPAVRSVTFISAETAVIKCQVGHVSVDISGNQTGALSTLALFEEVDLLVGRAHLFKRCILLCTAFFKNELLCTGSHAGFLSSYCVRTFILFIFNAYSREISSPLQGLYRLLCYLAAFDWSEHAFGLFGPIRLAALPKFVVVTSGVTAWPEGTQPLVTQQLLQYYSQLSGGGDGGAAGGRSFSAKYLNVIDPANPYNNLGRSVAFQNVAMIRQAMQDGASRLRMALQAWTGRLRAEASLAKSASFDSREQPEPAAADGSRTAALSVSAPAGGSAMSAGMSPVSTPLSTASTGSGLNDDAESELQGERDQKEAYRIVSLLFERTLQAYSGRYAFSLRPHRSKKPRPAALPILNADGQPLQLGGGVEEAGQASELRASTPSSPAVTAAHSSGGVVISDSELDTETEAMSASDTDDAQLTGRGGHSAAGSGRGGDAGRGGRGSAASSGSSAAGAADSSLLDGNLPLILDNLHHARQFDIPDVSEAELVLMIRKILVQCGSVPVGKLGSLLHNLMNNHSLPSMLKEKFGGLKRFIERHQQLFTIGNDHPFNPHVHLTPEAAAREAGAVGGGVEAGMMGAVGGDAAAGVGGGAGGGMGMGGGRPVGRPPSSRPVNVRSPAPPQQSSGGPSGRPQQQKGHNVGPWSHQGGGGGGGGGGQGRNAALQTQMAAAFPGFSSGSHTAPAELLLPSSASSSTSGASSLRPGVMAQHAGFGAQHRFSSTAGPAASSASQPVYASLSGSSAVGHRVSPHPRFVSSEGLNVTAPAFVSSYDVRGGGGQQSAAGAADGGGAGGLVGSGHVMGAYADSGEYGGLVLGQRREQPVSQRRTAAAAAAVRSSIACWPVLVQT